MLTRLEGELIETIESTLEYLSGRSMLKKSYMELMGDLRNALRKAEAVELGCSTGTHLGVTCRCPQDRFDFKEHKGENHGGGLFGDEGKLK